MAVIFTHSYKIADGPSNGDALTRVLEHESMSHIGVATFFVISGFLVSRSWDRQPRIRQFAVKRALRLMPALIVAVAIAALLVGPLVTTLGASEYLGSSETRRYLGLNAILDPQYTLPGVFTDNPFPQAVNGSLWTLPLEAKAYVVVAVLGAVGLLGARMRMVPVLIALGLLALSLEGVRSAVPAATELGDLLGARIFLEYWALFAAGAVAYLWRERIPVAAAPVAVASLVWVATAGLAPGGAGVHLIASVVLFPYAVICVAYLAGDRLARPLRGIDASYGVYVYAFLIQQLLAAWLAPSPIGLFLLATPIAIAAGIASWIAIERPALALKNHPRVRQLTGARLPVVTPADRAAAAPVVAAPATPAVRSAQ